VANTDARWPARLALILTLSIVTVSCGLWLDDEARVQRARDALENEQYAAAIIDLKNVLRNNPDNVVARKLLGLTFMANGDPEDAEKELRVALELGIPLDEIRIALAEAYVATGKSELALEIAQPGQAGDATEAFLLWLIRGDAQADLGRSVNALRSFEQAAALDTDNATVLLRVAEIYWNAGNLQDASRYAEKAILDDPDNVDGQLTLSGIYLDMKNPQLARETLLNIPVTAQHNSTDQGYILYYLSEAYLAEGDKDAARRALDRAAALWPAEDPDVQYLSGRIALAEGDNDRAATELLAYLVDYPESASAMRMLGAAQLGRGMINQAGKQLTRVLASDPRRVENRILLGRVYLAQSRFELAQEILEPVLQSDSVDPIALSLLGLSELLIDGDGLPDDTYQMARDQLQHGEFGNALATIGTTPRELQDDLLVLEILGLSYLAEGHMAATIAAFSKALAADADNVRHRLNLARAHLANGTFQAGVVVLQDPIATGVSGSAIRRALLFKWNEANSDLGHPDPDLLSRWLDEQPDDDDARWLLAAAYLEKGMFEEAISQYEQLAKDVPDDPAIHNNLAWSYLQVGDERARAHAELAFKLAPNEGEVSDTLGWILVSGDDLERGLSLLRDAHLLMPGKPSSTYRLAVALSRSGAEDEAKVLLEALLDGGGGPVRESAMELLSGLSQAQ